MRSFRELVTGPPGRATRVRFYREAPPVGPALAPGMPRRASPASGRRGRIARRVRRQCSRRRLDRFPGGDHSRFTESLPERTKEPLLRRPIRDCKDDRVEHSGEVPEELLLEYFGHEFARYPECPAPPRAENDVRVTVAAGNREHFAGSRGHDRANRRQTPRSLPGKSAGVHCRACDDRQDPRLREKYSVIRPEHRHVRRVDDIVRVRWVAKLPVKRVHWVPSKTPVQTGRSSDGLFLRPGAREKPSPRCGSRGKVERQHAGCLRQSSTHLECRSVLHCDSSGMAGRRNKGHINIRRIRHRSLNCPGQGRR